MSNCTVKQKLIYLHPECSEAPRARGGLEEGLRVFEFCSQFCWVRVSEEQGAQHQGAMKPSLEISDASLRLMHRQMLGVFSRFQTEAKNRQMLGVFSRFQTGAKIQ